MCTLTLCRKQHHDIFLATDSRIGKAGSHYEETKTRKCKTTSKVEGAVIMTDKGYDKANNVHIGSEHLCAGGMLATFDTGRYDACPAECGFNLHQEGRVIETMTEQELGRFSQAQQMMLSSMVFYTLRDPDMIGPMRILDLRNAIAKRLNLHVDDIRLFYEVKKEKGKDDNGNDVENTIITGTIRRAEPTG